MSKKLYVYYISIVAAIGGLLFGYDTAVISGTTEAIQFHFGLNDMELGWVVSSALVGCIFGVLITGWFADTFGRKPGLILAGVLFAFSAIGSAFPISANFLILARFIGGIGVGVASIVTPMYIAEISPPSMRGALVSVNQIAIVTGMVLAYSVNKFIFGLGDEAWLSEVGWRWMFGVGVVPSVIFLFLTLFLVESPRWLAKMKHFEKAWFVISKITSPRNFEITHREILNSLKVEEGKLRELFEPGAREITYMSMVLGLFQAITGINIVMYYAPRIFLRAGIVSGDAYGNSIIIGSVMVLFTIISLFLVDRLGRRPIMLAASLGMGFSLLLMGLTFQETYEKGMLLLICVLSFVAFFSVGMGGVYWVIVSEIFPNRVRGRAMTLSVLFLWGGNFLVAQFFPVMLFFLRGQVFNVFAISCFICFFFILRFVKETKGRTLEQIEAAFFSTSR